jgi:hypothetical protein
MRPNLNPPNTTHPVTGKALAGTGATDTEMPHKVAITQLTPVAKPATPHATPTGTAMHFTTMPIVSSRPVMVPTNNPQSGGIVPQNVALPHSTGTLALPSSPFWSNLGYPVIAFIVGALILAFVFHQAQ